MKYQEAGEYTLTYRATDECGNEETKERTITVAGGSESDDKFLIDVTNYTATNYNRVEKANDWGTSRGSELVVEAQNVVIVQDGVEYPTEVDSQAAWDLYDIVVQPLAVGEIGRYCSVWFYTDEDDDTKFWSAYKTEGDVTVPDEVRFGKLIVKRATGN